MNILEDQRSTEPRIALITGASSGIGRAFALRLGKQGGKIIAVGRRGDRLQDLVAALPDVEVQPVVADLATADGLATVAAICECEPLTLLVNNAGVSHYKSFTELPAEEAAEVLQVKVVAPTLLARAAAHGMIARGGGTIINVAGMLAFGAAAPLGKAAGRAVYVAALAHLVAFSEALHEERGTAGLTVQALCPGIVATEFHQRQGIDLSAVPRMSADDVVTASLRGLELRELICAPGVERSELIAACTRADLAAFGAQSPNLARRYHS